MPEVESAEKYSYSVKLHYTEMEKSSTLVAARNDSAVTMAAFPFHYLDMDITLLETSL